MGRKAVFVRASLQRAGGIGDILNLGDLVIKLKLLHRSRGLDMSVGREERAVCWWEAVSGLRRGCRSVVGPCAGRDAGSGARVATSVSAPAELSSSC